MGPVTNNTALLVAEKLPATMINVLERSFVAMK